MKRAAALKQRTGEETLTENVLYEIARRHQTGDFLVIPATKQEESIHGADWLFWFVSGKKGISYRVQAKKLFPSGRYESLFKSGSSNGIPVDPEEQIKKLIQKADEDSHIPLYCFYNFSHPDGNFKQIYPGCLHKYRPPSFWGCSIALAQDVSFAKSNALKDLRKFMLPWHLLACSSHNRALVDSSVKTISSLAEPKGEPKVSGDTIQWERPKIEISPTVRPLPAYVNILIDIERSRRENPASRQDDINGQAREVIEVEDLAGVVVFGDNRNLES